MVQFFIESDDVNWLKHLRLDLLLFIREFQGYFGLLRLDWSFIELSALYWRIRLGVHGWI